MIETAQDQGRLDFILSLKEARNVSLGSLLEEIAREKPQHPAFIFNNQVMTYDEFNASANRYANLFASWGFKKGDVVALMMTVRPEYLIATAGLSKLGIIVSLINYELRGAVLAHNINTSEARAVIVGGEVLDLFKGIREELRLKYPARILVENGGHPVQLSDNMDDLAALLPGVSEDNPTSTDTVSSKDILAYMFTSGSHGWRKGVPLLQQHWLALGSQMALFGWINQYTIEYMCLPLHLQAGFNVCFAGMLATGCTMLITPEFSVREFWRDVRCHRANFFMAVGEMCRYLYEQEPENDDKDNPLEVVMVNGMLPELMEPFRQRFGVREMIEIYGVTESVGCFVNYRRIPGMFGNLTINRIRQGEVAQYDEKSNVFARDENGFLIKCQPGETGVLLCEINDYNPFLGYVNEAESTEERLIHSAFHPGDLYLDTRDLVRLHENDDLSFVVRLGGSYRWKGKTVSTQAVEDVILRFFSGIEDVVVFGVEVPGMEGRCGMAVLQEMEDETIDLKNLAAHINRRMPPHARPIFLRIIKSSSDYADLQGRKNQFQEEQYNPVNIHDSLFYYDLEKNSYRPLTDGVFMDIMNRKIRL